MNNHDRPPHTYRRYACEYCGCHVVVDLVLRVGRRQPAPALGHHRIEVLPGGLGRVRGEMRIVKVLLNAPYHPAIENSRYNNAKG